MFITEDIKYVGVNDHAIDLFEGQYVVPNGMAYNSYVITDEKTAVMDSVEIGFADEWIEKVKAAVGGKGVDYLVVQHMEPDHSSSIMEFAKAFPDVTIVSSAKAFAMMKNFFGTDFDGRKMVVGEGDTLSLGKHTLSFTTAPTRFCSLLMPSANSVHLMLKKTGWRKHADIISALWANTVFRCRTCSKKPHHWILKKSVHFTVLSSAKTSVIILTFTTPGQAINLKQKAL